MTTPDPSRAMASDKSITDDEFLAKLSDAGANRLIGAVRTTLADRPETTVAEMVATFRESMRRY